MTHIATVLIDTILRISSAEYFECLPSLHVGCIPCHNLVRMDTVNGWRELVSSSKRVLRRGAFRIQRLCVRQRLGLLKVRLGANAYNFRKSIVLVRLLRPNNCYKGFAQSSLEKKTSIIQCGAQHTLCDPQHAEISPRNVSNMYVDLHINSSLHIRHRL